MRQIAVLVFLVLIVSRVEAQQIEWGGLIDLELKDGGKRSAAWVNQTPGDKPTIYTPNIRLFASSQLNEQWFVEGAIQADYYEGNHLSPLFISLFNVSYQPFLEQSFFVTAGRFVTPFGSYSERMLSSENPFVHLPVSHSWNQSVDKQVGFKIWTNGSSGTYAGQNLVYQRMYAQGLMLSGSFGKNAWLDYQLAATLASPSSHFDYGMHDVPALISRIVVKPWIGLKLGGSIGYGNFMKPIDNYTLPSDKSLSDYKQTIFGADVMFDYAYLTLRAEFIKNTWDAPLFIKYNDVWPWYDDVQVSNLSYSAEAIYRLPFFVGSYLGIRFEQLQNEDVRIDPNSTYTGLNLTNIPPASAVSGPDVTRWEFVYGYRLTRTIRMKASYLMVQNSGTDWDDDVMTVQLSVGF
ncbi:hypothetical protein EP331_05005 [bacterium]|nr:MAG: hypothetical protein EP331_05005 [bacterium]